MTSSEEEEYKCECSQEEQDKQGHKGCEIVLNLAVYYCLQIAVFSAGNISN